MKKQIIMSCALLAALTACSKKEVQEIAGDDVIRINQVGYYPYQQKVAVIEDSIDANVFFITDAFGNKVWEGAALRSAESPWSGKRRTIVDFSKLNIEGDYVFHAGPYTMPFVIAENALHKLNVAAMKSYYLQRTGMALEEQYAGVYARPAAHMDTEVLIHPSAANFKRKAGTVISSPYGWYDAGDFNKYIVNSGFTVGTMLAAYQLNPAPFNALQLNIPESGNDVPDFLDEIMYNLKWMISMQDPLDGGVYHKLTTPNFESFVMPVDAHQTRYVVQKGTCATLDFAATMAQAARIYKAYPEYADFADQALVAAEKAYLWAVKNPEVMYEQDKINQKFEPAINTGTYGDGSALDEFFWASTELYLSTSKEQYMAAAKQYAPTSFDIPVWGDLAPLGTFEWISAGNQEMIDLLSPALLAYADEQISKTVHSCFNSPFGNEPSDFHWASMPESCAGMGLVLMYANALTNDKKYLTGAMQNIDHFLGRNAVGYCFVTGFGTRPVMHPHQRISTADGIEAPMPGFFSGGPNPGQQDKAGTPAYPSDYPDESYLDHEASYASNEIAINWNAYLVALLGLVEGKM